MRKLPGSRVARWGVVSVALLAAVLVEPLPPLLAWTESETWARIAEWLGLAVVGLIVLALMGESDTEVDLSTTGIGIRPGGTGEKESEIIAVFTKEIAGLREDNALLAQRVKEGIEREKRLLAAGALSPESAKPEDDHG